MEHRVRPARKITPPTVPSPPIILLPRWVLAGAAVVVALLSMFAIDPLAAGPNRWTPIGIPVASIWALAVAPDAQGTVFAAGIGGTLFKSADHGASWTMTPPPLAFNSSPVTSVRVSPADPRIVYAVTNFMLAKSTDGGASWSQLGIGLYLTDLEISPSDPATLFATDQTGIVRSDDGGATWLSLGVIEGRLIFKLAVDPTDPAIVYAGTDGPVYKSIDRGITWKNQTPLSGPSWTFFLVIDPRQPATLYASSPPGLMRSTDGGASWASIDNGLDTTGFPLELELAAQPATSATSAALYAVFLAGDYASGFGKVYRSDNGGTNWSLVATTPTEPMALAVDPLAPGTVYAGDGLGVIKSADGGVTWIAAGEIVSNDPSALAADLHRPGVLYAALSLGHGNGPGRLEQKTLVYRTDDHGATWQPAGVGLPPCAVVAFVPDPSIRDTLYAVTTRGIFKSSDGATSWQPRGLSEVALFDLAVDPLDPKTLYAVGNSDPVNAQGTYAAYRSVDSGASWLAFAELLVQASEGGSFYVVRFDPQNPRRIYLAGSKSFKSVDGGATWRLLPLDNDATELVIDPVHSRTLYANDYGFRRSDDGGFTWSFVGDGAPRNALAIDPFNSSTLYSRGSYTSPGSYFGIVNVSTDRGLTWSPLKGSGLENQELIRLVPDPFRSGSLYVSALGGSVFAYRRRP